MRTTAKLFVIICMLFGHGSSINLMIKVIWSWCNIIMFFFMVKLYLYSIKKWGQIKNYYCFRCQLVAQRNQNKKFKFCKAIQADAEVY